MCCLFLLLVTIGPRFVGVIWWIIQPVRWEAAFSDVIGGGNLWWLWPVLGLIFLPWTTLMFVLVSPGGVEGWDWLWLGLMLISDIASLVGGAGRKRLPGYEGY